VKLFLATRYSETGNGYGYSIHLQKMRQALLSAGAILCDDSRDADVAIHIKRPDRFEPIEGLPNILFTQTELTDSLLWGDNVAEAVALVTSCGSSAEVLRRRYTGPIHVVPEGVDSELFPFQLRHTPEGGEPFRFLFVGNAQDPRKGFRYLMARWGEWQAKDMPENVELYVKASGIEDGRLRVRSQWKGRPIIYDNRNFSAREMTSLYRNAHAFVFPSYGEGWGLTLTEAMATGLPCIWTHWSAMLDYADETTGFPIEPSEMEPFWLRGEEGTKPATGYGARADRHAFVAAMRSVVDHYPEALDRGRLASERMHSQYTWAQAAEKFLAICERYKENQHGNS